MFFQVFQDAGAAGGLRIEVAQPCTDEPTTSKYKIPKRRASKFVQKAKQVQNMWNKPIAYNKPPSESRNIVNYEENLFEETQVPPEVPRVKAKPLAMKKDESKFSPVPIHEKLSHYDYKPIAHETSSLVLDDIPMGCLESDVEKSARMAEGPVLSSLGKSEGCPDAYFQFLCPLYGRKEASKMVLELYSDPTSSHHGSVVHGENNSDGSADNTEFGWEDDNYVYTGKYL